MKTRSIPLKIICIRDTWGFNETTFPIFNNIINKYNPDYSTFLNPNAFLVYYKINKRHSMNAKYLIDEIISIAPVYSKYFENFEIGYSEGEMTCNINIIGKIAQEPIGGPGNDVYKNIIYKLNNKEGATPYNKA